MKQINNNEFYRLKLKELRLSLNSAHCMIPNHNLSRGLVAESILRQLLKEILPEKVGVTQGFVVNNEEVSYQSDIILYDKIHFSPLYSYGETKVIPYQAVYCVIEVKSKINKKEFGKTLNNFLRLYQLGVTHKYLFIYEGVKHQTLWKYFYGKYVPSDLIPYDYDSYEPLPDAIASLHPEYYFEKDYCVNDIRDQMGYNAYKIKDTSNNQIVSLQHFITNIFNNITDEKREINNAEYSMESFKDLEWIDMIALFDM